MYMKHLDLKVPYYEAFSWQVVSNINLCLSLSCKSIHQKREKGVGLAPNVENQPFVMS